MNRYNVWHTVAHLRNFIPTLIAIQPAKCIIKLLPIPLDRKSCPWSPFHQISSLCGD